MAPVRDSDAAWSVARGVFLLVATVALAACAAPGPTTVPPAADPSPTWTSTPAPSATSVPAYTPTEALVPTSTPAPTAMWTPTPLPAPTPLAGGGWIALSAYVAGNWDIYALHLGPGPDGETEMVRLTSDPAEDRAPAFSPDGRLLAFASRRGGSWNVYTLAPDGTVEQLTTGPAYDGAPTWSPDGQRIAFDSMRSGNLDVWMVDLAGGAPVNLTADSKAGECDPVWSPDGAQIAFTSWRFEDQDIFALDLHTGETMQVTSSPTDEHLAGWQADGTMLYTVIAGERQEIYSRPADLDPTLSGQQLTRWWYADWPAWSPDATAGQGARYLAFLYRSTHGSRLYLERPGAALNLPVRLTGEMPLRGPLSWTAADMPWQAAHGEPVVLYEERTSPGEDAPYDLKRLPDVTVGNPWLGDQVDDSFHAMRQRVIAESGHDFLSELSDAWRAVSYDSERASYTSWHKAGRAIDTLMDYLSPDHRQRWLEIALEPGEGEVYWRLYLRCQRQDGSQGMPLKVRPWDATASARQNLRGGRPKPIPDGYYVDLTDLMAQYGWLRIAAHDKPDFDWHNNFVALEYWHFQKTGGLLWYDAMLELFPAEVIDMHHQWAVQIQKGTPAWLAAAKGVPMPWEERRKFDMLAP